MKNICVDKIIFDIYENLIFMSNGVIFCYQNIVHLVCFQHLLAFSLLFT